MREFFYNFTSHFPWPSLSCKLRPKEISVYQHFGKDLIGFIMAYINFSEQIGILSNNQRIGVITLLPKGQKDKKSLKNWRPITLLSTLYKIISGVIGNRLKKFLPSVIGLDQKGFVDGRYMGEVTRLLYDTIHDAYTTKGKNASSPAM